MDKGNPQAYQSHVEFMQKQHNQLQQAQSKPGFNGTHTSSISNNSYPGSQG
jgi:hypothetical protein